MTETIDSEPAKKQRPRAKTSIVMLCIIAVIAIAAGSFLIMQQLSLLKEEREIQVTIPKKSQPRMEVEFKLPPPPDEPDIVLSYSGVVSAHNREEKFFSITMFQGEKKIYYTNQTTFVQITEPTSEERARALDEKREPRMMNKTVLSGSSQIPIGARISGISAANIRDKTEFTADTILLMLPNPESQL